MIFTVVTLPKLLVRVVQQIYQRRSMQNSKHNPVDLIEDQPHPPQSSPEDAYGKEGTNKTQRLPESDAKPSGQLPGVKVKYIPRSPYTRG